MKYFIIVIFIFLSFSCSKKNVTDLNGKKNYTEKKQKEKNITKKEVLQPRSPKDFVPRYIEIKKRREIRLAPSDKLNDYLKPYRAGLKEKTEQIIAKLEINLTKDGDSSTLGRFAAQIILEKAREYSKLNVDFSVLNNGGLRKPLYKGEIKIKDIYELMPFDNYIVIVSLSGKDVKKICNEIIKHHGLPMAGIEIKTGHTEDRFCKVGKKDIDDKKDYLIATINYLYNVGEGVPTLKKGKIVKNMTNHLFRDAIIEYVKAKKIIKSVIPVNYVYVK